MSGIWIHSSASRRSNAEVKLFIIGFVLSLAAACSSKPLTEHNEGADRDACAFVQPVQATDRNGFLDEKNLREVVYCGSTLPRLWTGERARAGDTIDVTKLNGRARGKTDPGRTEFVAEIGADENMGAGRSAWKHVGEGIAGAGGVYDREIRAAGAKNFKPDELVTINLENQSLDFFVRQLMGGVLGVNYVANEDLLGTVTFRTEKPVPKTQVISIVRDILARNGQVMKFINNVYHIGEPATIQAIEQANAIGKSGELVTRVIALTQPASQQLGEVVKQIIPSGASVTVLPGGGKAVIQATPQDVDQVVSLVSALASSKIGRDLVAIVPLSESSPATVVGKINEFLAMKAASGSVISAAVIPLENQLSVLVGARGNKTMNLIRTLIHQFDRDQGEGAAIRVLPVKFLEAAQIAQQLSDVLGDTGGGQSPAEPADVNGHRRVSTVGGNVGNSGQFGGNGSDSDDSGIRAPALIGRSRNSGAGDGASVSAPLVQGREAAGVSDTDTVSRAATVSIGNASISIIADERNNALLIYSSYKAFKHIKDVVAVLDLPLSQVVIEATIVEVEINDSLQYGVQAFLQGNSFTVRSSSVAEDPVTTGGVATISPQFLGRIPGLGPVTLEMVLTALSKVTNVKVISSPYLTVLDGKSARLVIGDEVPFATRSQSATNDGEVTVTNQVETRDTGIIMAVSPKVRADNSLLLNISQEVSSAAETAETGDLTPIVSTREISSDISVQSGRTVVLGGLIQEKKNITEVGIPVLKEIPLVGELFKQTTDDNERKELLVLITPRVIRRSSQIERITELLRSQMTTY